MAGSPYRRRRLVWAVVLLALGALLFLSTRNDVDVWSLPAYLKDLGRPRAQEIHGLLHFVTAHPERTLDGVDAQAPLDMRAYAPDGDADWAAHMQALKEQHPLVVFSKSYCPYSKRAKALLHAYDLNPAPTIVELDLRTDGPIIQSILGRLTGRRTVPNVILQGESIGGSDDIMALHEEGELIPLLQKAGYAIGPGGV